MRLRMVKPISPKRLLKAMLDQQKTVSTFLESCCKGKVTVIFVWPLNYAASRTDEKLILEEVMKAAAHEVAELGADSVIAQYFVPPVLLKENGGEEADYEYHVALIEWTEERLQHEKAKALLYCPSPKKCSGGQCDTTIRNAHKAFRLFWTPSIECRLLAAFATISFYVHPRSGLRRNVWTMSRKITALSTKESMTPLLPQSILPLHTFINDTELSTTSILAAKKCCKKGLQTGEKNSFWPL
jgi:hypothetical protein